MAVKARPLIQTPRFQRDIARLAAAGTHEVSDELAVEHDDSQMIHRHQRLHCAQQRMRAIRLAKSQDRSAEQRLIWKLPHLVSHARLFLWARRGQHAPFVIDLDDRPNAPQLPVCTLIEALRLAI
jgi:hypothetical protein